MSNLIYANTARLWKNRIFLSGMLFMFLAGAAMVWWEWKKLSVYTAHAYRYVKLDDIFFRYTLLITIISAVFCPLFTGSEYGGGAMRNKIIAGHARSAIYAASLFTNIVACVLFSLSYVTAVTVLGMPVVGVLKADAGDVLKILGGSMALIIAVCSIFTMVGLLIQNRAVAPVVCIISMFLVMAFTNEIQRVLDEPRFYLENEPNPNYVDGKEREQLEFFCNLSPAGQGIQYAKPSAKNVGEKCLCSLGTTVISTAVGIFFFCRKDIR